MHGQPASDAGTMDKVYRIRKICIKMQIFLHMSNICCTFAAKINTYDLQETLLSFSSAVGGADGMYQAAGEFA